MLPDSCAARSIATLLANRTTNLQNYILAPALTICKWVCGVVVSTSTFPAGDGGSIPRSANPC